MDTITSKEEKAILEFRNLMKDDMSKEMYEDTHMFYKFLKARNFKLKQAERMLRKHLDWRKSMQLDTILTEYKVPEVAAKYVPQNFLGFDKDNCPFRYFSYGRLDAIGLFLSANRIDILKFILYIHETDIKAMKCRSEKVGKQITQCVFIYDLDKLNFVQAFNKLSIEIALASITIFQDNYPELLKSIYVINAGVYFTMLFPIFQKVLADSVIDKIQVFGKDGWKEKLLKVIDAEVLPAFLGGTRTDPDGNPLCKTFINYSEKIPESFYLKKNIEKFGKKEGVLKVLVNRSSCYEVRIEVNKMDSFLEWEFEIISNDIGFSLALEESDSDGARITKIMPMYKFTTEYEPIRGSWKCKKLGTYIIVFDNTYSWFYSKYVYYRIRIKNQNNQIGDFENRNAF